MKKVLIYNILLATMFLTSCERTLDINRDPDSLPPDGIAPATELPSAITGIAGAQGAELAIIGGMWSQYWTQSNAANQYRIIDSYSINSASYQGPWNNMYDALGDVRNVKRIALDSGNWNYYLITVVLDAYASQLLVDWYDQIPYTEANDPKNLNPAFQNGEEIYDLMIGELNTALAKDLSASNGDAPGKDDYLFGGDMAKWVQFANTLKLKLYLRQTEARPGVAQAGYNSTPNNYLTTDAAITQFIDEADRSNPLYESDRRQLNTATNLRNSTTMSSYLKENSDPRLDKYYTLPASQNQGDYESTAAPASIGVVVLTATDPLYFISAENSLFMQAEADLRYKAGAGAKALYDAAVTKAFSKWGLDASTFIAAGGAYEYPATGSFDDKLKAIITQKWVSCFPGNGFEAFFEQNRTGYPAASAVAQNNSGYVSGEFAYSVTGITGGLFPKRLPWPSDEVSRNANAIKTPIAITAPVWWNK